MKILIQTQYLENYSSLAEITNANKREYCLRHGYDFGAQVGSYDNSLPFGFQRIKLMLDTLDGTDYDFIFWQGVDTFILNHTVKIESFFNLPYINLYDYFICADVNGLNDDSAIIKNTEWSKKWLRFILSKVEEGSRHCWFEQKIIQDYWQKPPWVHHICIFPQNMINSYFYDLYNFPETTPGHVKKGDFLLHLPGMEMQPRIDMLNSSRVQDFIVK